MLAVVMWAALTLIVAVSLAVVHVVKESAAAELLPLPSGAVFSMAKAVALMELTK